MALSWVKMSTRSPLWRSSRRSSRLSLAGAARASVALLAVGAEGLAALGRAERQVEELAPAVGLAHVDARLLHEAAIELAGLLVAEPLLLGQSSTYRVIDPVLGQELAAELGDLAAVDDRADELVEVRVRVVGAFGRGGQARAGTGRSRRWPPGRRSGRAGGGTRRRRSARTGCPSRSMFM